MGGRRLPEIVFDADVLMNVLASECAAEILAASDLQPLVTPTVAREALFLYSNGRTEKVRIDIDAVEAAGIVQQIQLVEAEFELLVQMASLVDDGEAEVISVAVNRTLAMATDDRRARNVALAAGARITGTPELLHRWQIEANVDNDRMGEVLRRITMRSRYRPAPSDPLFGWWQACAESPPASRRRESQEEETCASQDADPVS